MVKLPLKTLEWLLEDSNPPVRNLTKKFILDEEPTSTELNEVNEYSPIKTILSLMNSDGSWSDPNNPYQKYIGSYWQFTFLSELNANPSSDLIKKACDNILSYQLKDGGFTHKKGSNFPLICLSANILRSLVSFGYEKNSAVQKGIDFVTQHTIEKEGVGCYQTFSLLPNCQMALTKVLALYATLSNKNSNKNFEKASKIIINNITANRIFRYIPQGTQEFKKAIKGKKTAEIRQIKEKMIQDSNNLKKTDLKQAWKKFGFPQSYTSDALETLYWLARMNVEYRSAFGEALNWVITHMDPSGYWINENNFRNPTLVEIEPKKGSSKWITSRACYVLKTYNKLEFDN
jgi:hypothetical protein